MNRWWATIFGLVLMHAGYAVASSEQSAAESIASIANSMNEGLSLCAKYRGRPAEQLSDDERSVLLNELLRLKIHRASLLRPGSSPTPTTRARSRSSSRAGRTMKHWKTDYCLRPRCATALTLMFDV